MSDDKPTYWFPAKRYGWGWGPPVTWQGWVVMGVWVAVLVAGAIVLAGRHWVGYGVFLAMMVAGLIAVCWMKGERPRWRWGGE
jgi:hypothetical protein